MFHRDIEAEILPQLGVAWTISHPAVHVAVVGARRFSQLEALVPAAERELSAGDRAEINEILAGAVRMVGPSPEGV